MIQGIVNAALEPTIELYVGQPDAQPRTIRAIIDTGFNDYLTLPAATVAELKLPLAMPTEATLADDRVVQANCYRARVTWDGQEREIPVLAFEAGPFVGTALMRGYELSAEMVENGRLVLRRLS